MDTLKEWQVDLMAQILASREHFLKKPRPEVELPCKGFVIGTLVYDEDLLPRRQKVWFLPSYGVVAYGLCTSNGSARMVVRCVPEGTRYEPLHLPLREDIEKERLIVLRNEEEWASVLP
jgi:hypothetical protein